MFKAGEGVIITWHPTNFQLIGMEAVVYSEPPCFIGDILPVAYFKEKFPSWAKYVKLEFQSIQREDLIYLYPVIWMQRKIGFDPVYSIVKEKNILTN